MVLGPSKLIDSSKLAHVYVSPRQRAQKTFDLLFSGIGKDGLVKAEKVTTAEELAEWGYGLYEGLITKEIRKGRKERGLDVDQEWDIWRDGCEGGE
jgi:broad specificity phosphatase PhoE